ncbi:hypothetical protein BGZ65_005194 [Modicella reniformis]|uniref:Uncharacterized protein n=1 Tax=Modicella reniformis TaxID=1440133 RepID=A0A9P6ST46_9FUNG|nr:hypothetical protein BGZ65_005194 [Modicella reniformis]
MQRELTGNVNGGSTGIKVSKDERKLVKLMKDMLTSNVFSVIVDKNDIKYQLTDVKKGYVMSDASMFNNTRLRFVGFFVYQIPKVSFGEISKTENTID